MHGCVKHGPNDEKTRANCNLNSLKGVMHIGD